jgi:predicted ATP-dependent serine protease
MKLGIKASKFEKVSEIKIPRIFYDRMKCGIKEFDDLFGNGILPGSSMTFTGQAGCGKTTSLLQLMESLSKAGYNVGYSSGEENKFQLAFTCKRLNVTEVSIANETDIDELAKAMTDLDMLVIDSFQALTTKTKMNRQAMEQYAVSTLVSKAKETECALVFVMHRTKDGKLKGSTLVPHSVDVNFEITMDPDGDETERLLTTHKNRFGATGEWGATMTSKGLELTGKKVTTKALSKSQRKAQLHKQILKLDPPNITEKKVMKLLDLTKGQAYVALKELTDSGKIVKFGRGVDARWKKVNV